MGAEAEALRVGVVGVGEGVDVSLKVGGGTVGNEAVSVSR
jgi:hypothetical protein